MICGESLRIYVPSNANKHAATREKKVQQIAQPDGPEGLRPSALLTPSLGPEEFSDSPLSPISGFDSIISRGWPPSERSEGVNEGDRGRGAGGGRWERGRGQGGENPTQHDEFYKLAGAQRIAKDGAKYADTPHMSMFPANEPRSSRGRP